VSKFHVPGSECAADEFQAPDGAWFSIFRAIVFDSWLIWRDALPSEPELREQLDGSAYECVTALAKQLHLFHQSLPCYRGLTISPFHVSRWWDPTDTDQAWNSGGSVLFYMDDYSAADLLRLCVKRPGLKLRAVSQRYVEASLVE
jgi:hypothetical protein